MQQQPTSTTEKNEALPVTLLLIIIGIAICHLLFPLSTKAQGNLLLMPRRVVFEGTKKYEELNLANIGKDTARYIISLMHIRMKEDGNFEQITEPGPGENFADKYIRFFPRSVTLAPNESQVVKIQLNRTNELTPGEYRSHLYFRAIPNEPLAGETQPSKDSSISIKLVPVFGISIPVIVRAGESDTQVSLTGHSIEMVQDTIPILNMSFSRKGNMSVYGDLSVDYISDHGKTINAGTIKGLAVYTPNATRQVKFGLMRNKDIDYHSGKLHITYTTPEESGKKTLAETDLVLR